MPGTTVKKELSRTGRNEWSGPGYLCAYVYVCSVFAAVRKLTLESRSSFETVIWRFCEEASNCRIFNVLMAKSANVDDP